LKTEVKTSTGQLTDNWTGNRLLKSPDRRRNLGGVTNPHSRRLTAPQSEAHNVLLSEVFIVMRTLLIALILSGSQAFALSQDLGKAIQLNVEKYQLENGLTVLLQEDHSVPLVSYQQWFRVGSKDELPGKTGLAHFFEHMMFKGTEKYSKETFGQTLAAKGAEFNAFTTADYTGYYITLPSNELKLAISIESDRMRNLLLKNSDVVSEREVVKEEKRMRYDNQPEGIIRETMSEMIYKNLPYRYMVIGSMDDLNKASQDDLHAFYKRFYSPNNAVVVIAGDFNRADTKKWIQEAYGQIPREVIERINYKAEWDQPKAQEKVIHKNVQSPIVAIGYLSPKAADPDGYALDLLTVLLGQGDSSRLHKKMVYQDQTATGVSAGCQGEILAGRCMFYAYLKPNGKPEAALKTIEKEIRNLSTTKITEKELEKAKNNYLMEYVGGLKKIGGRAESLAYNEILFGDYKKLFTDIPAVQAVTVDEIQAAAKKYLKPAHENVIILLPDTKSAKGKSASSKDPGVTGE
jgi:zinc protease